MRMIRWGLVCIFSLLLIGCSQAVTTATDQMEVDLNLSETEIAYTYFDLTNGEATLIQSGKGGNVLIGTGEKSSQEELAKLLQMFHVQSIDTLVLINDQSEYVGNVKWLMKNFIVGKVVVPYELKGQIGNQLSIKEEIIEGWKAGQKHELLPKLAAEVLYAGKHDSMESGLILSLLYGSQRTLYMGLADEAIERELVDSYPLKSAVLKVGEFGSPLGTSAAFLKEVDPQVAILFQKKGNVPSETVIERLQETWIDIYQTNKNGTVSIKCTKDDYQILTVHSHRHQHSISD